MKSMNEEIQRCLDESPIVRINSDLMGKYIKNLDIIVKVCINVHDQSLLNRDICRVVAHLQDGTILIQRLEDNHVAIVNRSQISLPNWGSYEFT